MSNDEFLSTGVEHLINVLQERDIDLGEDDVLWAFNAPNTKDIGRAWVKEYLNESTLLSKEELELYENIVNNSLPEESLVGETLSDDEIAKAITSLQTSTSAIERQVELLQKQQESLSALRTRKTSYHRDARSNRRKGGDRAHELGRLNIQVEDLSYTTDDALQFATTQAETARSSLTSVSGSALASDDRTLARIVKIADALEKVRGESTTVDAKRIDLWCRSLVRFRSAAIKSRVDKLKRSGNFAHTVDEMSHASKADLEAEQLALEEELRSLNEEVDPVAEMVVDQDLRTPLTRLLSRVGDRNLEEMEAWSKYAVSMLEYIIQRLSVLRDHAEDLSAYEKALIEIEAVFKQESMTSTKEKSTKSHKPQRSISAPPPPPELEEISALLQHFSLPPNPRADKVPSLLSERTAQLDSQQVAARYGIWKTLTNSVTQEDADIRSLLERVYAYTDFATTKISDSETEKRLDQLDKDVAKLGSAIKSLENGETETERRAKEEFINKWG